MPSKQIRPPTSELLELHVLYVPEDVWNFKLNTVPIDNISRFFSAGFIRMSPHLTLRTLREQLGEHLGEDAVVDKYIFLKCIGKKLAVVKSKQETELKLKLFAPPYALYPELYLLPGIENTYSSSSVTPERNHSNKEYLSECVPWYRPQNLAAPDCEISQTPQIWESSLKNQLSQIQEKGNLSGWNETEKEHVALLPTRTSGGDQEKKSVQEKYILQIREKIKESKEQKENRQIPIHHNLQKTKEKNSIILDTDIENGEYLTSFDLERHTLGDSGIIEPLDVRGMGNLHNKRRLSQPHPEITKSVADNGSMLDSQTDDNNLSDFAHSSQYLSPPTPPLLALSVNRHQVSDGVFPKEGTKLHKQLQHIKLERKHLEWSREELIKNVKGLIEQNKLRRYHARDSWKKKYFEVKKVTVSLEEVLNKLLEDLDIHYQKLLVQLQARDVKKINNITKTANSKNNTIIQITTLQHEIDQLRRQLDNAKMKLIIEIKMRKQAASDLQALKAELAHKKKFGDKKESLNDTDMEHSGTYNFVNIKTRDPFILLGRQPFIDYLQRQENDILILGCEDDIKELDEVEEEEEK